MLSYGIIDVMSNYFSVWIIIFRATWLTTFSTYVNREIVKKKIVGLFYTEKHRGKWRQIWRTELFMYIVIDNVF